MTRGRPTALVVLSLVVASGCIASVDDGATSASIDPDDPPFQIVVDDDHRYGYEVVWRDRNTTRALNDRSLDITEPGNYTLRVLQDGEVVAVHDFVVHRYELAGCNRDFLRVRGATIGSKIRTQAKCAHPSDIVERPG